MRKNYFGCHNACDNRGLEKCVLSCRRSVWRGLCERTAMVWMHWKDYYKFNNKSDRSSEDEASTPWSFYLVSIWQQLIFSKLWKLLLVN